MGNSRHDNAFSLVEILIVVAVIGIISAIALPNFFTSKATADRNACIANLGHLRSAVDMWALDTNAAAGVQPMSSDLVPAYIRTWPKCLNSSYAIPAVGADPACPNSITDHIVGDSGTSGDTGGGGGGRGGGGGSAQPSR
ncbi:MAG: prepilin-type N-terminal cleavage/methylation domain-containing protein [Candidatus Omnitrophica bacterium]|nr:prepilin-type N-terminal cleavage/methylation domain-containing protein [Candidatus Omnitrophota bacterium]